jgi:hypothetical protein
MTEATHAIEPSAGCSSRHPAAPRCPSEAVQDVTGRHVCYPERLTARGRAPGRARFVMRRFAVQPIQSRNASRVNAPQRNGFLTLNGREHDSREHP